MIEETSFKIDLWSIRNTKARGVDGFKEQKMSIPTLHFEYFKVTGERSCLMDGSDYNEK